MMMRCGVLAWCGVLGIIQHIASAASIHSIRFALIGVCILISGISDDVTY